MDRYECYSFAAEKYVLDKLKAAGVFPFKTKMHFRLNKLRKEIKMDTKRNTLREYIKHLHTARRGIEDKMNATAGDTPGLDSEFMTLGVVIKDLEKIDAQEFSYWDVS